jgi:hypothetical protein
MSNSITLAQYGSTGYTTGFRNRLINGDFRIWQQGTSITTTGGGYTADMWIIEPRSSQSTTISQSTDVPTGEGHAYSGRFTATGGSLQGFHIRTAVELPAANNYGEFQPGTVWTLSLWAKSVYTGVAINPNFFLTSNALSNPNSSLAVAGGSQTIAQSWTKYTWTVTMPTWTVDSGSLSLCNNLTIRMLVGAGAQDLYITGAQFEPGAQVTPFDRRHIVQETQLAQRYYEIGYVQAQHYGMVATVDSGAYGIQQYIVTKRTTPAISVTNLAVAGSPSGYSYGVWYTDSNSWAYMYRHGGGSGSGNLYFRCNWQADARM